MTHRKYYVRVALEQRLSCLQRWLFKTESSPVLQWQWYYNVTPSAKFRTHNGRASPAPRQEHQEPQRGMHDKEQTYNTRPAVTHDASCRKNL